MHGTFSGQGLQRVTLVGEGTPIDAGEFEIPISGSGSNCSFNLTVTESSTPTCSLPNNTAEIASVGDLSFNSIHGSAPLGQYVMEANASGGDLKFEFFGPDRPAPGVYQITTQGNTGPGKVLVTAVAANVSWQSTTGLVFVTDVNGKLNIVMCDIAMSGSLGGPSFNTTVSANITEQ